MTRRLARGTVFPLQQEIARVSLQNAAVARDAFVRVKLRLCTRYHFSPLLSSKLPDGKGQLTALLRAAEF